LFSVLPDGKQSAIMPRVTRAGFPGLAAALNSQRP